MDITATFPVHTAHALTGQHRQATARPAQNGPATVPFPTQRDEVRLSQAGQLAAAESRATESTASTAGVRFDLVNRVRAEIAAGTYDTPDKMSAALDRMLTAVAR